MTHRLLASSLILLAGCFEDADSVEMNTTGTTTSATAASTTSGTAAASNTAAGSTEATDASTTGNSGIDTIDSGTTSVDSSSSSGTAGGDSTGERPNPELCPLFTDDFADGREAAIWIQEPDPASIEEDGEWKINVSAAGEDIFARMRLPPTNFEGSTARFQIGIPPANDNVLLILWLQQNGGEGRIAFNLIQLEGQLQLQARFTGKAGPPGVVQEVAPWEPGTQQWLQLREDDGMLHFESSMDGNAFDPVFTLASPITLDDVSVGFAGHNRTQLDADVQVSIQSFELACGPP